MPTLGLQIDVMTYTDADKKSQWKEEENLNAAIFMRFALK